MTSALNDRGEFARCYKYIYPPELKVEHQRTHVSFLDLDITNVDGIFSYTLFDKTDNFPYV